MHRIFSSAKLNVIFFYIWIALPITFLNFKENKLFLYNKFLRFIKKHNCSKIPTSKIMVLMYSCSEASVFHFALKSTRIFAAEKKYLYGLRFYKSSICAKCTTRRRLAQLNMFGRMMRDLRCIWQARVFKHYIFLLLRFFDIIHVWCVCVCVRGGTSFCGRAVRRVCCLPPAAGGSRHIAAARRALAFIFIFIYSARRRHTY